jgi:hypothetical protein
VFATLLAQPTGQSNLDYSSPLQAYAVARGQLSYYRVLQEAGEVRLINKLQDLNEHIAAWQDWEKDPLLPVALTVYVPAVAVDGAVTEIVA